jgi:transcriptional regulator with XRE-family HTH domain
VAKSRRKSSNARKPKKYSEELKPEHIEAANIAKRNFNAILKAHHLDADRIAQVAGIPLRYVRRWLNLGSSRKGKIEYYRRLCEILGIGQEDLFDPKFEALTAHPVHEVFRGFAIPSQGFVVHAAGVPVPAENAISKDELHELYGKLEEFRQHIHSLEGEVRARKPIAIFSGDFYAKLEKVMQNPKLAPAVESLVSSLYDQLVSK